MAMENLKLVVFALQTKDRVYQYGIPIGQVHEITRPGEVTQLPGMPDFIEGVMNLRGSIIPIMDLKKRFRLGATVKQDTTRVIVANFDKRKCGIIVDDVLEIIPIVATDLEEAPSFAGGVTSNYIIGIGKVGERLIIALDIQKILTAKEENSLSTAV
jgi:purine-binding chemotaxis protein CheW